MDLLYKQKYIKYKKKYTELKQQIGGEWTKTDKTYFTNNTIPLSISGQQFSFPISDSQNLSMDDKFVEFDDTYYDEFEPYYSLRTGDLWFIKYYMLQEMTTKDYGKIKNKTFSDRAKKEDKEFYEFVTHSTPSIRTWAFLAAPHSTEDNIEIYELQPQTSIKLIAYNKVEMKFMGTIAHNGMEHKIEGELSLFNLDDDNTPISRES